MSPATTASPRLLLRLPVLILLTVVSRSAGFKVAPPSSPSGRASHVVLAGQRRGQFVGGSLEFGESPAGGGKKGGKNKKKNVPAKGKQRNKEPIWTDVSGVTFPEKAGDIRAWELNIGSTARKFACVRPRASEVFLVDGTCSRCAFDLWRGEIILPSDGSPARLSCPVCGQVYELSSGEPKGIQKKEGFNGWVNGLVRSATLSERERPIASYPIRARRDAGEQAAGGGSSGSGGSGGGSGKLIVEVDFSGMKDVE